MVRTIRQMRASQLKSNLSVFLLLCGACLPVMVATGGETTPPPEIEVQSVELQLVQEAEVPAQEAGLLTSIRFREGQQVKRGEVLAQSGTGHRP